MPRRLAPILTTIFLVFLPLFFAPKVLSWDKIGDPITSIEDLDTAMEEGSLDGYLKEFCAKRQGNQMNLETWYSGKCPTEDDIKNKTFDTFSGQGVGFSDIILLDLAEKISGEKDPNKTFTEILTDVIKKLKQVSLATPQEKQLAVNSARQKLFGNNNTGLIGQTTKMISLLYQNQPASTGSYLAYVSQNLQKHKILPQALAAEGIGFSTFSPFLTIWLAFRNLAYLGIVVFFIVYGFMMMFRVNLGQKTVISVQLAIPKLIVTLLIITFSFAIVGLIYDLMWVVIAFIFSYFETQNIIVTYTPVWNLGRVAGGYTWASMVGSFILNTLVSGPAAIFGILNLIFGGAIGAIAFIILPKFGGVIVMIVVIIAVLISYVKLFIKLISAFISVVISLITAPLVLLGNAFPGSQVIGTWLRSIIANLSVFPVTMILLFFSYLLMIQPFLGLCTGITGFLGFGISCEGLFGVKNLVTSGNSGIYGIPLISPGGGVINLGFNAQGILALLGVGLLLMAAKYVDIVRDALKVPPFKYGTDIASALKGGYKGLSSWAENDYKGAGPLRPYLSSKFSKTPGGPAEMHVAGKDINTDKLIGGKS